jgi:GxxExxY protein
MINSYHKRITNTVYKLALNVQKKLGNCFTTQIYKDALECEFLLEGLPFRRNVQIPVYYGDDPQPLSHKYTADFIIGGKIIVMVHGSEQQRPNQGYELITMLQATRNKLALLVDSFEYNVNVSKIYSYTKTVNSVNQACEASSLRVGLGRMELGRQGESEIDTESEVEDENEERLQNEDCSQNGERLQDRLQNEDCSQNGERLEERLQEAG